jgi:hypothetical protein
MSYPIILGQVGLHDSRDLGLLPCHFQATWVWHALSDQRNVGLEGHVRPKLIIIIIIIIIIIVFTL